MDLLLPSSSYPQHVSEAKLVESGYSVQEIMLKVCPDLRPAFSTEPCAEAVHCPGQCIVSTQSKLVMLAKVDEENSSQSSHMQEKQVVVYK